LAERQASKDEEVEETDNEAEKKSSRLQAEAEAGSSTRRSWRTRWRTWALQAAASPKRRVPGGASRRTTRGGAPGEAVAVVEEDN
jgi:hypothetical protein